MVPPDYDHSFVLSIHCQLDDVTLWHPRELLSNDVLQINKISHALKSPKKSLTLLQIYLLVVLDDNELQ